jgi:hypothetical protein
MNGTIKILVGTKKGAFILTSKEQRSKWSIEGPIFLGSIINHFVGDPRDKNTMLIAARTGHLGPTIFRSKDQGKNWKEAEKPPAFAKATTGDKGRVVKYTFWLTPGHASEPDTWYAGTSPHGLFRSEDAGKTWNEVIGFNNNPERLKWSDNDNAGTPDGPITHSILIDSRDRNHMYIGLSTGGVFETKDKGESWNPLNKGTVADFLPVKEPEYGQDPHQVIYHPLKPDRLYQQNHCGIYRIDRDDSKMGSTWIRIGKNMPKEIGDIGFPIVLHPRDIDTAWVFPMDGTDVWPRTCVNGDPVVYVTRNAGNSWESQKKGFPKRAWWTVLRQAMKSDMHDPVGLYFGTTSGEIWASIDAGESWNCIAEHLPHIYSLEIQEE